MSRLNLNMTLMDAAKAIAEDYPGSMAILAHLTALVTEIDPVGSLGGLSPLMLMDEYQVYGESIHKLFRNVGSSYENTYWILRAVQLGIIDQHQLQFQIHYDHYGLDINKIVSKVEKTLERLNTP